MDMNNTGSCLTRGSDDTSTPSKLLVSKDTQVKVRVILSECNYDSGVKSDLQKWSFDSALNY